MHPSPLVTPESSMWCPPSLPPPDDWAVSIDKSGAILSLYGDSYWNFSAFGYRGFNFGKKNFSASNQRLIKQTLLFVLYHPKLFPGKISSCKIYFELLCKIANICDEQGIIISELSKFPRAHSLISNALKCSRYNEYINKLHKLLLYSEELGFTIADKKTIEFFVASNITTREIVQHPYIPPRIWSYQVSRLNECIDDFIQHKEAIKNAFTWLSDTYEYNASCPIPSKLLSPFCEREKYKHKRIVYKGDFETFLKDHQLYELFSKWLDIENRLTIQELTKYLNLVVQASLFYILNFSMQRISEVKSLNVDCFFVESDPKLGEIALIVGETTKTDPDSDARWIVPKSVKKAVDSAALIAGLRNRHRPKSKNYATSEIEESVYLPLLSRNHEPWGSTRSREPTRQFIDYRAVIRSYPKLFDQQTITITDSDWKVALSLTPNLEQKGGFGVGLPWNFSAHQLRRTTSVNMFASKMVSDHSIQWEMKHLTRKLTLYYGRNYTNLRLNSEVETAIVVESYRAIYRQLVAVVQDRVEYVRPHNRDAAPQNVLNLIDSKDEKQLIKLIKSGDVGCRQTLLGYCMKSGSCEYGGIESVAKCAGVYEKDICVDAIFDRKNEAKLIKLREAHQQEMADLERNSPRFNALKQEIYAIGVYCNVVNR